MVRGIGTKALGCASGVVLCGILVAGLWPFHGPRNDVNWLGQSGVTFGPHGSVVSSGEFALPSRPGSSCSIEIRLYPSAGDGSGTIFAFYNPDNFKVSLALRQSLDDLLVETSRGAGSSHVYVQRVFHSQTPQLITITSGTQGTVAYINGAQFENFPNYRIPAEDLSGKLLMGNTPARTHEWSGEILALAFYNRDLTHAEIVKNYDNWTKNDLSAISKNPSAVSVYPFNERGGSVVHNHVAGATDLLIPERFFVVNEQFLAWPWNEFYSGWGYWKDVAINVGGFIPLGACVYAFLRSARMTSRPMLVTIILGFVVSLTIEVLQAFLPTRDSGTTDIITNTLGTALGALFLLDFHALSALIGNNKRLL